MATTHARTAVQLCSFVLSVVDGGMLIVRSCRAEVSGVLICAVGLCEGCILHPASRPCSVSFCSPPLSVAIMGVISDDVNSGQIHFVTVHRGHAVGRISGILWRKSCDVNKGALLDIYCANEDPH